MFLVLAIGLVAATPLQPQTRVTAPQQQFGHNVGDDYFLANYTQFEAYWRKLAEESPRMVVEEIGTTAEGRPQLMAIITSPENHRNLARYKEIARRLALADGVSEAEARRLASEGKAVVWIDGGLHATEIAGGQHIIEMAYQMTSLDDEETRRFLDDVILLLVHANPDGMELVADWYMRDPNPESRSTSGVPRLYQKYAGHDNNRDSYIANMPETENQGRILYREWFPQIMYNHHQTGPAGAILFAPPFRDPFNYNFDPLVPLGIDAVGAAMHERLVAEGKPGATMRTGASYSTWWNGGMRTTVYFHNMIGLLTEISGNPTPIEIPLIPDRQLPSGDLPFPVKPQVWHFRQTIDYQITADRAVLDYASRNRDKLLYNIYLMGKNSIERGSRDNWTIHPQRIEALKAAAADQTTDVGRGARGAPSAMYESVLHDPAFRDPRGYILPSDQPDLPTAAKFVNTLIKNGVTVHQATADFRVGNKSYPKGSFVVKTAQAFRPHIMDMFEPQDHPNDFEYPGGPPIPPYDVTGWTLAFQMGVQFDRILDGFSGPFQVIEGFAQAPAGTVSNAQGARGYLLSHSPNNGFIATNRLHKDRERVYWLTAPLTVNGKTYPAGTIYIRAGSQTRSRLERLATDLGIGFEGVGSVPQTQALEIQPVRVGLWDQYGGSMPSGWTRWLMEQFEFPFEVVYPPTLNQGNLKRKYDVLIFPDGAIPAMAAGTSRFGRQPDPATIPEEYRNWLGSVSIDTTVPQLKRFLDEGGTIITIGNSANLAAHLDLPMSNHMVDASGSPLPREKYFIPGSLLEVRVDNTLPVTYGLGDRAVVTFDESPVFRLEAEATAQGVRPLAWFDSDHPLASGWAWGQQQLKDGVAAVAADVGRGKLYMFGPEVLFRGQPHGTFKLVFNGIQVATAKQATVN